MNNTDPAHTAERPAVPPLTKPEKGLAWFGAVAAAAVGALGLVSSFDSVSAAAARWGFSNPQILPVAIDVAIPVFTLANLLLIRLDMALAWVRFVPWTLTLVTCWLNIAAGDSVSAKVAHGTMPLLWVVFSEIGAHVYAVRIGAATGRRMERIRWSRWLLAPVSTFTLWRRMTLWEITSYADALTRERKRLLTRAELRERYGRGWRWKTPRRERVLLRIGELAPADTAPLPELQPAPEPEQTPEKPGHRAPKPSRKRQAKSRTRAVQRTPSELLTEARALTADWPDGQINAEALRKALRCGAGPARQVRDALLAERTDRRILHPVDAANAPATGGEAEEVAA